MPTIPIPALFDTAGQHPLEPESTGGAMQAAPQELRNMISLEKVSKSYGDVEALHETDLVVREGEFLSLLGPSGSGKTTILNIIAGAVVPTSGRILLNGRDVSVVPPRERGLGMVFQNYALLPHLTVFENVAFPLRIRRSGKEEIAKRVRDALQRVGLVGYEHRKPRELSGGQQQRVGIARCIVYSPSVILMDEPLGALDKKLREQLQAEIKALHRDLGTTIVYVTHDQEEALDLSDRVCLMNRGRVAQVGTPHELYFEPVNEFVADFVGESNLIEGRVSSPDTVTTADGFNLCVRGTEACASGSTVKVLVRPEKVRVMEDGVKQVVPAGYNICTARIEQTSFVGGMSRISFRTDAGLLLRMKMASSRGSTALPAGGSVTLGWAANDSVVLKT